MVFPFILPLGVCVCSWGSFEDAPTIGLVLWNDVTSPDDDDNDDDKNQKSSDNNGGDDPWVKRVFLMLKDGKNIKINPE